MAIGRPWRAIVGWLGRLIGRERQTWVEPGNAITRAVLSGAELSLPEFPGASWQAWEEALPASPVGGPDPTTTQPAESVPAPGDGTQGTGDRRHAA